MNSIFMKKCCKNPNAKNLQAEIKNILVKGKTPFLDKKFKMDDPKVPEFMFSVKTEGEITAREILDYFFTNCMAGGDEETTLKNLDIIMEELYSSEELN